MAMSIEMACKQTAQWAHGGEHILGKPRIWKGPFSIWYCGGKIGKFGMGYTPAAAYAAWGRNVRDGLRNPE